MIKIILQSAGVCVNKKNVTAVYTLRRRLGTCAISPGARYKWRAKRILALLFLLIYFGALFGQSKAKNTLLFLDKTQSIKQNSSIIKNYEKKLNELVLKRFDRVNCRLKGFYVHGNTLGVSSFHESTFEVKYPNLKGLGELQAQLEIGNYKKRKLNAQSNAYKNIQSHLSIPNPGPSGSHTDLWGTLEIISDFFTEGMIDSAQVVYMSDMEESMSGSGRRDFHTKPPKSKAEAEQLATIDFAWVKKNMKVNEKIFKDLEIKVWPPADAMQGGNYQFIKYYWEKLFAKLNAKFEWVK